MHSDWRKFVVVLSLLLVVVGALTPDACADDSTALASTSATLSRPHTSDQPFGCQHEEDCFCCAHIAPTAQFVLHTTFLFTKATEQLSPSSVDQVLSAPYHPPKA